jgi:hypothetical protein
LSEDVKPIEALGGTGYVDVVACTGYSISEDGTTALLRLTGSHGSNVQLTFPVGMIGGLQGVLRDMRKIADGLDLKAGTIPAKFPKAYLVGHSPAVRGHVAIAFNAHTEDEETFMLPDATALGMVEAIRQNIFSRMSSADRRARVAKPAPPKIILPS